MDGFEDWYDEQHRRVFGVCVAFAADRDRAREATDEAFTRALERWDQVAAMESPGGWVQVVAVNQLRRLLRRRRLEMSWFTREEPRRDESGGSPDSVLWVEVRALPLRQRTAVVLRFVGDLSESEIAAAMQISRGTVSSTLHRALSALREAMDDVDETQEAPR